MMANMAEVDVLVIGAGPAGIASAYALQEAGISYEVVDRSHQVGDTWASLYPSLNLNTTRFYSHMPGKRFPLHYGLFPTGQQYHDYLCEFVAEHDFNIHLGVTVKHVAPEGNLWRVETNQGVQLYKVVITATGIFGNPVMPKIEGIEDFTGTLYHSHDFKDPEQVRNQRVLVIGSGPSGIDIAVTSSEVAAYTAISMRSGVSLKRRYPLGIPMHGWLLLTDFLPQSWCEPVLGFISRFTNYRDLDRYGLVPTSTEGLTPYVGPELLNAVKAGALQPLSGPTKFYLDKVEFADGQCLSFDTVICATGFTPVLQNYLDIELTYNPEPYQAPSKCDWRIGPNGQRGFPMRDTSEHPNGRQILGHPGLYLVGTFYKGKGAMYNMNVEAEIAANQIKQYLATL